SEAFPDKEFQNFCFRPFFPNPRDLPPAHPAVHLLSFSVLSFPVLSLHKIRYSFFQRRLYLFLFQNTSRQPDRNFQNFVVILMNPCTRKKDPASRQDPYHQENLAISSS